MSDLELIQYIEAKIGGEGKSGIVRPMILAIKNLALADLARLLIDTDSELSNLLQASATNQSWASSSFTLPSDFLYHKQKETTRVSFGTTPAYQVTDRRKLDLSAGQSNIYYVLEGNKFIIKHTSATSGSDLNIFYYKIPAIADINSELRNVFLDLVLNRLIPPTTEKTNGK